MMTNPLFTAVAAAALSLQPTSHQPGAEPANGPVHAEPQRWALVGGTIHTKPGTVIEDVTVLIVDHDIHAIRTGADPAELTKEGWRVRDVTGQHVYPGFVDAFVEVDGPEMASDRPGAHWCDEMTPERDVLLGPGLSNSDRESLRKNGFVAAAMSPRGGVMRGSSAVVSTAEISDDASTERPAVYRSHAYLTCAIEEAQGFRAYPTSHMGAVALIRQALIDARWWRETKGTGPSYLEAIDPERTSFWFDTSHELEALLATKIEREFDLKPEQIVIVGSGTEVRRLAALKEDGHAIVEPLRFPATPDVDSVAGVANTTLEDLMLWEQAPTTLRRMKDAGLVVAITSSKLPEGQQFHENLAKAIKAGLSEDDALAMLTTNPAALLHVDDRLGTIEAGKAASLVISDKSIFDAKAKVLETWVEGHRYEIAKPENKTLDGSWTLRAGDSFEMGLTFDGKSITCREGEAESKARKVQIDLPRISFVIDDEDDGSGSSVMSGLLVGDRLIGTGVSPDGSTFEWVATRSEEQEQAGQAKEEDKGDKKAYETKKEEESAAPEDLGGVPFGEYAMPEQPSQESVLFTNATIWTEGPQGTIERGYIYIQGGKIVGVGSLGEHGEVNVNAPRETRVIDLDGKHITPGIIDSHSHSGLFRFGVNESGQAVTAECRISDSLDPGNIAFYRELAGGVTTANLLHGSANPIGGQNQVVKLRWGSLRPEDMFFEGAKPGIKFALGENVKQSNWGERYTTRYPQTRMGVETLMRDRFEAARAYAKHHDRRDLELETLAQILAGERLVHCHSYRQDEILMLCRIAEDFGFQIGTFQHGLEVYKVPEVVREHAIGAGIFSDWWAYKVEVQDAIPYAGPMQTSAGVLTSYNSDSDELARRLNTEAAKALKYDVGDLTPEQALAFVTINPAKELEIDDRVGSLERGKDADLAIWSGSPLASTSRCEGTWIDGCEYFSLEKDAAMREHIRAERERLIQKALGAPKAEQQKDKDDAKTPEEDEPGRDAEIDRVRAALEALRAGRLPADTECACGLIEDEAGLERQIELLQTHK